MSRATKTPTLIVYWADTREPLTYWERMRCLGEVELVSLTPSEVLIRALGRMVVVRESGNEYAPAAPKPLGVT